MNIPFSYPEIRLLFLIDGIAIRFHVCSYFLYVCLDDWCLFGQQWKNFLEVMFKFLWSIILNFWNRVKKDNQSFAWAPKRASRKKSKIANKNAPTSANQKAPETAKICQAVSTRNSQKGPTKKHLLDFKIYIREFATDCFGLVYHAILNLVFNGLLLLKFRRRRQNVQCLIKN